MKTKNTKVLIARTDRIGDLILSLPMEDAWLQGNPDAEVLWLANQNLKFVFEHAPSLFSNRNRKNCFFTNPKQSFLNLITVMRKLSRWLDQENFDVAISVQIPWWVAFCLWRARIPVRVGVASKWFSFLFYNYPVRQKRSQAVKNEALYNLDLVQEANAIKTGEKTNPEISLNPLQLLANELKMHEWRAKIGEDFIVIHPGMAGSALNWKLENYKLLAEKLIQAGERVVVTGTVSDRKIVENSGILNVRGVLDVTERTPSADLLAVLALSKAVVAPSTGVIHLAAALGKKTIGIYSLVRVESPRRWAPQGLKVQTLTPPESSPTEMEKITVDRVTQAVLG